MSEDVDISEVLAAWTQLLYEEFGALHHWDVAAGVAIYRVFLLPTCLQVDVAFTPASDFGARGPHLRVVFGSPIDRQDAAPPAVGDLAGRGWLALLHANASIERQRFWQAEYWISSVRDDTFALACLRLGHPPFYAKGVHRLPPSVTAPLEDALVRSLDPNELRRALRVATHCLIHELTYVDPALAGRIDGPLRELTGG